MSPMMPFLSFPHLWRARACVSNLLWTQRAERGGARRSGRRRYLASCSNLLISCCSSLCHWWSWFSVSNNLGGHEHDAHSHRASHVHGGMKEEHEGIFLYSGVGVAEWNIKKPHSNETELLAKIKVSHMHNLRNTAEIWGTNAEFLVIIMDFVVRRRSWDSWPQNLNWRGE